MIHIIFLGINFFTFSIYSQEAENSLLRFDYTNAAHVLPINFNSTRDLVHEKIKDFPSLKGLDTLKASKSGQFSEEGLSLLLRKIGHKKVTILDVRGEFHGFINTQPISWYVPLALRVKKTKLITSSIEYEEQKRLSSIHAEKKVKALMIEVNHVTNDYTSLFSVHLPVKRVLSERELANFYNIDYQRLPVRNLKKIPAEFIDTFVQFVKTLSHDTWLHIHCKAGSNRSALLFAMYDIMKNAKEVAIEDILERQFLLGVKWIHLPHSSSWDYEVRKNWVNFLKKFHEYCKTNCDNFQTPWSQYIQSTSALRFEN